MKSASTIVPPPRAIRQYAIAFATFLMLIAIRQAGGSSTPSNGIIIDKAPAVIEHKTFDPNNPPANMPKLAPPEAAVTVSQTGCSAEMSVAILDQNQRGGRWFARVRVDSVQFKTQMDVTVWLPPNPPKKLKDHEEGHRQISELFYKNVEAVAADLIRPYIGRTLSGEADNGDAAVNAAIKGAIDKITGDFMAQTEVPASKAQEIYDDLTHHGTNRLDEKEAIRRAIEQAASSQP